MKVKIMIEQEVECCYECICCHVSETGTCWCDHPNGDKEDFYYFTPIKGIPEWCPAKKEEKNNKGEWITRGGYYHCSQCGERQIQGSNFCPSCGARMHRHKGRLI